MIMLPLLPLPLIRRRSEKTLSHAFSPIRVMAEPSSPIIARRSGLTRLCAALTPQPTRQTRPMNAV